MFVQLADPKYEFEEARYQILALLIVRQYGLEVPLTFEMPDNVKYLAPTMPKPPRSHDKYYMEGVGGTHWPWRGVIW